MAWQEPMTKFERRLTLFTGVLIFEALGALWFLWAILEALKNAK